MKLTLHVGMKKTGTTSLQYALMRAKPLLAGRGLCFPADAATHQRLARSVKYAADGKAEALATAEATLDLLAAEIRSAGPDHVLLSSEHLISASAEAVKQLHDMLRQRLPEITETTVLCYVREPVSFATSMCQQNLKNGVCRLAAFYAAPWPYAWAEWLTNFATSFGKDSLCLRYFHPGHLKNGDILDDFPEAIGVSDLCLPGAGVRRNTALSHEGVLVADALVGLFQGTRRAVHHRARYRRSLEKIPGRKFVLPAEVQDRVIEASRGDLRVLKESFGLEIVPEPVEVPAPPDFPARKALSMALDIVEEIEGGESVT